MELFLIVLALTMDSVAISIASGSKYRNIDLSTAIKIALYFSIFLGLMPLLGYHTGSGVSSFVDSFDHYISFAILVLLGYKMIQEARDNEFENELDNLKEKTLLFLAIATSMDAFAVGISFSFEDIDIHYAAILLSSITFVLCITATYVGKYLGGFLEDKAEYFGGIILIIIGFKILIEGQFS